MWTKRQKTSRAKFWITLAAFMNWIRLRTRLLKNWNSKRITSTTFISKFRKSTKFFNNSKTSITMIMTTCSLKSKNLKINTKNFSKWSILLKTTTNPKQTRSKIGTVAPTETSTVKYPKIAPSKNAVILLIWMAKLDNWLIELSTFKNSWNHKIHKNCHRLAGKNLIKLPTILKSPTKSKWQKWKMIFKFG